MEIDKLTQKNKACSTYRELVVWLLIVEWIWIIW